VRDALPPPLPPETRTVGQLIAESIRFYQEHFWACLPLGLVIAVLSQDATLPVPLQVVALAASSPFMAATYVRAISLVTGAAWSWTAVAIGTIVFLPVSVLILVFVLPAAAWLAFVGLAVPAVAVEGARFRAAFGRGMALGRIDFVHAWGSIAALTLVYGLTRAMLTILLQGQADVAIRTALFLADLVLSPLLFVGSALLYVDQRARLDWSDHAPVHPPLDALDPGRADAQGES
jgi:hypothetical protein